MWALLGSVAIGSVSVAAVVACGSSTDDATTYETRPAVADEYNVGEGYVPSYPGYGTGTIVATNMTKDTKAGDTGVYTTFQYKTDGSREKAGLPASKPFQVTYNWTMLPSDTTWTMPVVDHLTDAPQEWYSHFYDESKPNDDPGSVLANFSSIHDGDTFSAVINKAGTDVFAGIEGEMQAAMRVKANDNTIVFKFNETSTRIFGADSPEVSAPDASGNFVATTGIEKLWGDRATDFVKQYMGTANPVLFTPNGVETYGRIVTDLKYAPTNLVANGTVSLTAPNKQEAWNDLSLDLVRYGLARIAYVQSSYMNSSPPSTMSVNTKNIPFMDYLLQAQATAFANRVGIWMEAKRKWWNESGDQKKLWNPFGDVFPKTAGPTNGHGLSATTN